MKAQWLPNGALLVPARAEGPDGLIGDGMVEVLPGTPLFREWLPWAEPRPAPALFATQAQFTALVDALAAARARGDGPAIDRLQAAVAASEQVIEDQLTAAFWDEDAHPRDEKGRFGPGGGSGAAAPEKTPQDTGVVRGLLGGHPDTETAYRRPDGSYTPERAALHAKLVGDVVDHVPPSAHPTLYAMGGGGGSGKSFILSQGIVDAPDAAHAAHVNADDFKERLPEYQEGMKGKDKDAFAAAATHEESSSLAKETISAALKGHKDTVVDAVLDTNAQAVADKVAGWRKGGAERVEATYVTVPVQVAVDRAMERAARTGRVVPEAELRRAHASVAAMFPSLLKLHPFDKLTLVENVSGGRPKVLLTQDAQGKQTVHDRAGYRAFLQRGVT